MASTQVAERMPDPVAEVRTALTSDAMQRQFAMALPAHVPVERFTRVVMTAIQNNADLLNKCSRQSLFNSCMKAAQDGLLPDGRDGAIVAFKGQAQWMVMIGGLRKKVRNSKEIATWETAVVHENDLFKYRLGDEPSIEHIPTLGEQGPVIAAYSVATLKTGEKSREVMSVADIEKVRKRSRAESGPWFTDYEEMCRKTVARRHSKVLPMSSDLDDLLRRDDELYDIPGAAADAAAGRPRSLAGKLDQLAQMPDNSTEANAAADAQAESDNEAGEASGDAKRPEPQQQQTKTTATADAASSAAGDGEPGSADKGSPPAASESGNATDKPAETGKAVNLATPPTKAADYPAYARAHIAAAKDGDTLEKWWKDEKKVRNALDNRAGLDTAMRDTLETEMKARAAELRK